MCTPDKYIHDKIGFREQKQMTAEKRKEGERKKERKERLFSWAVACNPGTQTYVIDTRMLS